MYILLDNYENDYEFVARGDLKTIRQIAKEYVEDTDGECYLIICNRHTGYKKVYNQ